MDEKQDQALSKVNYVKPEILDLGAVTPAYGADCKTDGETATGTCLTDGLFAANCNPFGGNTFT